MITKQDAQKLNIKTIETDLEKKNELLEFLKASYPQTVSDGAVNLKAVAQILGCGDQNAQGYELTWTGKGLANALYSTPCEKYLTAREGYETSDNQIIIGDNLDALKLLNSAYNGKIKMIYIDPPYNTKSENFIYPDDYRKDYKHILKDVGLVEIDGDGAEIESETLKFFKNITGSRSHSGWLSFMLPRLKLARDLLKDDGVIFISIDDNEQANLKLLCDEIFGEENFMANFIWEHRKSSQNDIDISLSHNYTLCYAKNNTCFTFNRLAIKNDKFSNPDTDPRGDWVADPFDAPNIRPNLTYPITNPVTGVQHLPPRGRHWRFSQEKFASALADARIVWGKNGKGRPQYKRFKFEAEEKGENIFTIWQDCGTATEGTKELQKLFNINKIFDTPKPVNLIKKILQVSTNKHDNDIVLDFFAGSGTTAHAVMEQNLADGGDRKFILVQIAEKIDEIKKKFAYDFVKNELGKSAPTISDITIERVKRVAAKLDADVKFSVYDTADKPSAQKSADGTLNLTRHSLCADDKARNLALSAGKTLDTPLSELVKDELYLCADALIVVACGKETLEMLRKDEYQSYLVVLDGYADISFSDFANINLIASERLNVVF